MSRPLDRRCQGALMLGASTRLAAWANLATIRNITTQLLVVFIVDVFHAVGAEIADTRATIPPTAASSATPTTPVRSSATAISPVASLRAIALVCSFCFVLRSLLCVIQVRTPHLLHCVLVRRV